MIRTGFKDMDSKAGASMVKKTVLHHQGRLDETDNNYKEVINQKKRKRQDSLTLSGPQTLLRNSSGRSRRTPASLQSSFDKDLRLNYEGNVALIRGVEAPLIKRLDRWKALHLPAVLGPLPHILHLPETALENLGGTPAQTSSTPSPSTATPETSTCRARLGKTPIGLLVTQLPTLRTTSLGC